MARGAELSLWPAAEFDQAYDDNVKLSPDARKGDFLTAELVGAALQVDSDARTLLLTHQSDMVEHVSYLGEDRYGRDHYAGLRDDERLTPNTSLDVSESFVVGNSLGGSILTNGQTPIGAQLMGSLFSRSTTIRNDFAADLQSRYSKSFTWTANAHQNLFAIQARAPVNKYSFGQGSALGGRWNVFERFTAGMDYQFDDFRFSNSSLPTTASHWLRLQVGWGEATPYLVTGEIGPIVAQSSAGTVDKVHEAATTTADVGFLVSGRYTGRRLLCDLSASQEPALSSGLGGFSTVQTESAFLRWQLTRRMVAFANAGYYAANGNGIHGRVITYAAGITYQLAENVAFNVQYLGYRTLASGGTSSQLVAVPGRETDSNFFLVGMAFATLPLRWRL